MKILDDDDDDGALNNSKRSLFNPEHRTVRVIEMRQTCWKFFLK
jgi:hypothetical protein